MNGLPYIRRHFDFGNLAEFLEPYFNTIPKNNTYLETGDAMSSVNIVMPHTMPELDGLMILVYQACEMFYDNLTKEKYFSFFENISLRNPKKKKGYYGSYFIK